MCQHPSLVEALAKDRVAELRRNASATAPSGRERRPSIVETARHRSGWLLVDIGIRLAVPHTAVSSPVRSERRPTSA